ncbi:MAG: hypothetical protein K2Q14_00870 [Gammaproteobacteria bacterium]|nr:hypothetical protein [Gammaproteobacteria bacterium]
MGRPFKGITEQQRELCHTLKQYLKGSLIVIKKKNRPVTLSCLPITTPLVKEIDIFYLWPDSVARTLEAALNQPLHNDKLLAARKEEQAVQSAPRQTWIKSAFSFVGKSLLFLLTGITGSIATAYVNPTLQLSQQINQNFSQVKANVRAISITAQQYDMACSSPVDEEQAMKLKATLITQGEKILDSHSNLGHLVSPKTYCAIHQITASVNTLFQARAVCSPMQPISDAQVNQIIQMVNNDQGKFRPIFEYEEDRRDKLYQSMDC